MRDGTGPPPDPIGVKNVGGALRAATSAGLTGNGVANLKLLIAGRRPPPRLMFVLTPIC